MSLTPAAKSYRDATAQHTESRAQRAEREAKRAVSLIAADPNVSTALRDALRAGPHAVIARGSERWQELREDIAREVDNDAVVRRQRAVRDSGAGPEDLLGDGGGDHREARHAQRSAWADVRRVRAGRRGRVMSRHRRAEAGMKNLHNNGWAAAKVTEAGKPAGYVGVGTSFTNRGLHFIVVAKTADDLTAVMEAFEWDGQLAPEHFQACMVVKAPAAT
jgi:hypothetical protein